MRRINTSLLTKVEQTSFAEKTRCHAKHSTCVQANGIHKNI